MSAWQPIKSAPRDGRAVLVVRHGKESQPSYNVVYWDDEGYAGRIHSWIHAEGGNAYHKDWPTHWMPLPDPPNDTSSTLEDQ